MTKRKPRSIFQDYAEGPVEQLTDGRWTAVAGPKVQLESLSDRSALYLVHDGRRVAYRGLKDGQPAWIPMREGLVVHDEMGTQH